MATYSVVLNETGTTISFTADEMAAHGEGPFIALMQHVVDPADETKIIKIPVFVASPGQVKAVFLQDALVLTSQS